MKLPVMPTLAFAGSAALVVAAIVSATVSSATPTPPPRIAAPQFAAPCETVVLAGGSFWGVQAVFEHVKGVESAVAGYAGGGGVAPTYVAVSEGRTDFAEAVEVTFDPKQVGLGDILRIYFSIAHDPTQVNRQGADYGQQYRSEIFADRAVAGFARGYIAELNAARVFGHGIVTKVSPLAGFYPAEPYHQDYVVRHPAEPYVAFNDLPKIANLKWLYPAYYRDRPKLVVE